MDDDCSLSWSMDNYSNINYSNINCSDPCNLNSDSEFSFSSVNEDLTELNDRQYSSQAISQKAVYLWSGGTYNKLGSMACQVHVDG